MEKTRSAKTFLDHLNALVNRDSKRNSRNAITSLKNTLVRVIK